MQHSMLMSFLLFQKDKIFKKLPLDKTLAVEFSKFGVIDGFRKVDETQNVIKFHFPHKLN